MSARVSNLLNQLDTPAPKVVVVTGAAGNIAYSILFGICRGALLGPDVKFELRLLDIPPMLKAVEGVMMEIKDGAFPLVTKLVGTADPRVAFKDADVNFLIGAMPRKKGMLRADLLRKNAKIFESQGKVINEVSKKTCKTIVVGNPANTNSLIASTCAPSIPSRFFSAMTRLDQNRAKSQLADRIGCNPGQIKNVIIWGNHSKTQYPDVSHAYVEDFPRPGHRTSVMDAVNDVDWLRGSRQGDFIPTVQQRGAAIIKARGSSSAASAANAAIDHGRDLLRGIQSEYVAVSIESDGSYGIPKGIVYSFPCHCVNEEVKIVQGLKIDEFSKKMMMASAEELLNEKKEAAAVLGN